MKVPVGLSLKLHAKWIGPFYITNVSQNNTYKIRRASDHKILKSRIHANRLKHYEDPRNYNTLKMLSLIIMITLTILTQILTQIKMLKQMMKKILGREMATNYYRVKWVGYKKATWVPEEDIGEGLLIEFYTKYTKDGKLRKRKLRVASLG